MTEKGSILDYIKWLQFINKQEQSVYETENKTSEKVPLIKSVRQMKIRCIFFIKLVKFFFSIKLFKMKILMLLAA